MGLFDAFTGAAQAKTIKKGMQAGTSLIDTGQAGASNALSTQNAVAQGYVSPYMQSGGQFQQGYNDLLGLNGDDARRVAQARFTSDDLLNEQTRQGQNAALRLANARGMGGSGAALLADARVRNEGYQRYLDRFQQGGQQGLAAAGLGADLASRYGSNLASLIFGGAQQKAGIQMSGANALAQAQSILPQNLLGLGSMALQAFTPGWGGISAASAIGGGLNKLWGGGASSGGQPAQPPMGYYTNPMYSTVPYGGF